jgi:PAS domain S-box-containing protein
MPLVESLADTQELRRCIRDMIALSSLPVIWKTYDPPQIAGSLADALLSMLDAEFVHISLPGGREEPSVEVTRTTNGASFDKALGEIRSALSARYAHNASTIVHPVDGVSLHLAFAPIGLGSDAVLLAGSRQSDFPTEKQRLLLGIGANDATIALQRWQMETGERRFTALVESSSDFIAFTDLDGVPQYINAAGLQLVGLLGLAEASSLRLFDFLMPSDAERAREKLLPCVMRDGRWVGELGLRHFHTGEEIPLLVDWFRIDDPRTGRPMNLATVSRDLSAQKRSEAELRHLAETLEQRVSARTGELADANKQLTREIAERERADARLQELQIELFHAARLSAAGQMAAALAHELNQPLTAVTNYVNAARRLLGKNEHDIGTVREIIDETSVQALRAGQIIRRLRDFLTRGETEKRFESLDTLVEEACALALTGTGALGMRVVFNLDPNASQVFVNRIQIQQVLINLIRNAVEALAESQRRELVIGTAQCDHETVEIAVADSGPGLAKDVLDHLFEPFVSTKHDGMGLGLTICQSIVEAHGGRLGAEPNPGGGTIFRFTLAAATGGDGDAP